MIRIFDIIFSIIGIFFCIPLFLIILFIGSLDTGRPLFVQKRVGYKLKVFNIIKFRSMRLGTENKGTHLVDKSKISSFGFFLRRTKLDELPQLLNVLVGNMSLVGPRPCLVNQKKLIHERKKRNIFKVRPGITGLAQIKNITMKTPTLLAKTDFQMIKKMNIKKYFYYIFVTFFSNFRNKT